VPGSHPSVPQSLPCPVLRHAARPCTRRQRVAAGHRSGRGPSPSPPPRDVTPSQDPHRCSPSPIAVTALKGAAVDRPRASFLSCRRCRGQAPTPTKQHVRTIAAVEVPCRAFAGVPPMPKLADAAAHLLLPAESTTSSLIPLSGTRNSWSFASVSTGAELRHVVSRCLPPSEPLR
jgi:hypothetical protein